MPRKEEYWRNPDYYRKYQREYDRKHRKEKTERVRKWREKNPDKIIEQHRRYYQDHPERRKRLRNNYLQFKGRKVPCKKRIFYGICELCGLSLEKYPFWHHWNDKHLEWGLWLDWRCHIAVETAEKRESVVIPLYDKLKELIEQTW